MSVTAIIPAYNEEKTIKEVIEVVKKVKLVDQIIVVSDGSTDKTVQIAQETGVDVIALSKNKGKGGALSVGVKSCSADVLVFLDADLIGLQQKHVVNLIKPVIKNKAEMSIGVFVNGKMATDLAQKITPFLSGQRVLKRKLFEAIECIDISKYGVEILLTKYVKDNNIECVKVDLDSVSHVTKEEKLGLIKGFNARIKMYYDIVKSMLRFR